MASGAVTSALCCPYRKSCPAYWTQATHRGDLGWHEPESLRARRTTWTAWSASLPIYKISPLPRGIPWNIPVENAMSKNQTVADKFEDRTRAALGIEDFLFHASAIIVAHSPSQPDTDIVSHGGRLKLALPTPSVANDTCQSIGLYLFSPAAEKFGQQFPCCVAAGNIPHRKVAVSASARQCHFKLSCPRVPYHAGP